MHSDAKMDQTRIKVLKDWVAGNDSPKINFDIAQS